jgi:hypothetical protein
LRALRQEPSARQAAIRIANDLSSDEIAGSALARNTFILMRQTIERGGLSLTATGNLSRAVVAEMCKLIEWPGYGQANSFRLHKVINEPDFLPLHIVRLLAEAAQLVRTRRGKLVVTSLGKSMLSEAWQGSLQAILFHLAFWHMDLGYFGRGLAIGLRRRLANRREVDAAVYHPGARHSVGDMGQVGLRSFHGGFEKFRHGFAAGHRIQLTIRERALIFERRDVRSVVGLARHHHLHLSTCRRGPCYR